jgi:OHCU decarboxylase
MSFKLSDLNAISTASFVAVCDGFFEHSPWVAERVALFRPYGDRDALHRALCAAVDAASAEEKLGLIRSHPDLVGEAAQRGDLTSESAREQTAAGLAQVSPAETARFRELNAAYWARFGFPFVICARENKKDVILATLPIRLANAPEVELRIALDEIGKIAKLRLFDAIEEG